VDKRSQELLRQLEALVGDLPPEDRLELVGHLTRTTREPVPRDKAKEQELLREAQEALTERHDFRPGQLVEWKTMLRNRQLPEYGQAAVVLEVLDEPVVNESEPADSPYYREPLDLILGVIDGDGDVAAFHFDGRRFKSLVGRHFKI
jgi:hypothetical protein